MAGHPAHTSVSPTNAIRPIDFFTCQSKGVSSDPARGLLRVGRKSLGRQRIANDGSSTGRNESRGKTALQQHHRPHIHQVQPSAERSIQFVEMDGARAISASDGEISLSDAELSLEAEDFSGECARQNSLPSTADSAQRFQPGPRRRHRDGSLSFFNPPPLM